MVDKKDKSIVKREKHSKTPSLESEREIAMEFATKIHQKFDRLVKATILFGSQAKNTASPGSDIDLIVIIDDASLAWDLELISWYREELGKLMSAVSYSKELHINTIKLTTWWQDLLRGDPVIINILRYGEPLIDSGGFFIPMKMLLQSGKIKATHEAVYAALQRAPSHLARSRISKLSSIEGMHWCMVDSAQAALMLTGKLPPSPEHIPEMLHETFVVKGMLKSRYIDWFKELYTLHKDITHGALNNIKSDSIDVWYSRSEEFLGAMTSLIDQILK